jgi:hypothetical protein
MFIASYFASNELMMKNEAVHQHKPGNINEKTFIVFNAMQFKNIQKLGVDTNMHHAHSPS